MPAHLWSLCAALMAPTIQSSTGSLCSALRLRTSFRYATCIMAEPEKAFEAASSIPTPDGAKQLLLQFAARRTREDAKEEALKQLFASEPAERDSFLDDALAAIDNASLSSLFAKRRWPLPLPSRRAALGSYARLLDTMAAAEDPVAAADVPARRRRSLVVLLRQLRSANGVWALERTARLRSAKSTSIDEMLARTPEGLETPVYSVAAGRATWEVRCYDEFSVATTARDRAVTSDGPRLNTPSMPAAGGFQALAGYIFGKNDASEKMAMTTPVFTCPGQMSFVLPSRYWASDAEPPPAPIDSQVSIGREGGGALARSQTLACLWFGGLAGPADVAKRKDELRVAIETDAEWEVCDTADEPLLLQYNDPFTPPWSRRNEVAIAVQRVG